MRLLFAVLILAMLPATALAELSNYTRVLTYDEISLEPLNNTNITILNATVSEDFTRTTFFYLVAENNTEVCIGPEVYSFTSVKTEVVNEHIRDVVATLKAAATWASEIRVIFEYSDGTSEVSATYSHSTPCYVEYTLLNPHPTRFVNNYSIQLRVPQSSAQGCNGNEAGNSYMKLSMENITARGDSSISVSTTGYKTRSYAETLEDTSQINITAYLLSDADATLVNFQVIDLLGTVVSDANMTVEKFINNTWTRISAGETDGSGSFGIYLKIGETYRVVTEKEGFTSNTVTLTITSTNYILRLSQETLADFDHMFENLFYEMLPPINELLAQENQTVSWTVNSSDSQITDYALLVMHPNGTVLYEAADTESAGGNLTANLNLTGYPHRLRLKAYGNFTKAGYPTFWVNRSLYINNYTMGNRTLYGILPDFDGEDGLGTLAKTIVSLTIITVIAGGAAGTVGGLGAGAIALALLGFFTFAGWFSGTLFMGILLLVLGIYVLKGRY